MRWEELTALEFKKAVDDVKCCILTLGILEKHGDHLPLGTDCLNGHEIGCIAAEKEPAVVFPPFYFGQIYEAKCFPGTVALKPSLVFDVIQGVIDEIGRNGFEKIIIYNSHGGNNYLVKYLAQCSLYEEKPYDLYFYECRKTDEMQIKEKQITGRDGHGHACIFETSVTMYNFPDLVDINNIPQSASGRKGRMNSTPYTYSGFSWYADYPEHFAGDATGSNKDIGHRLVELYAGSLAEYIGMVKRDKALPALRKEFFQKERDMEKGL